MTNQSDRQADARSTTGTKLTYEGDTLAYFDSQSVPAGDYNGRLLAWINQALGTNYKEINGAKTALANSGGAPTWDGLGLLGGAGGATYDAAANALFAAMTTPPTSARKTLLNNLIVGLKADGLWTLRDCLYLTAAETDQAGRLNIINPGTFTLSKVNNPAFVTDRGFSGDGASSFLDSGFNPTLTGAFSLNNAGMGVYVRSVDAVSSMAAAGNLTSRIGQSNVNVGSRANDATNSVGAQATVPKSFSWSRLASGTYWRYVNGTPFATAPGVTTTALTNATFQICASNGTFGTNQIAAAHWGPGLNDAQELALYNRMFTYLSAIGAA